MITTFVLHLKRTSVALEQLVISSSVQSCRVMKGQARCLRPPTCYLKRGGGLSHTTVRIKHSTMKQNIVQLLSLMIIVIVLLQTATASDRRNLPIRATTKRSTMSTASALQETPSDEMGEREVEEEETDELVETTSPTDDRRYSPNPAPYIITISISTHIYLPNINRALFPSRTKQKALQKALADLQRETKAKKNVSL